MHPYDEILVFGGFANNDIARRRGQRQPGNVLLGVPLIEIAPEIQTRARVPVLVVRPGVADPARKPVCAAALHGDLDAAGVTVQSVAQHRARLRECHAAIGEEAELGFRRVDHLTLLPVVSLHVNAQFLGEQPIQEDNRVGANTRNEPGTPANSTPIAAARSRISSLASRFAHGRCGRA